MNVLQKTYGDRIRPAVEGMLADETGYEISTWLCGTAAGIHFARAVSMSTTAERTAVIGGSAYIGVTVRDITLVHAAAALDMYSQYENMGVLTRGRIWVKAGAKVAPADAVYYDASGVLGNSASGSAAGGTVEFTQQPDVDDTITLGGTAITFKASGANASQCNIGNTLADTVTNLAAKLNASSDTALDDCTYYADGNTLIISNDTVGTAGNSFTVATTVDGVTLSGATLAGGTASGTLITGARWLTSAITGQLAIASFGVQV